MMAKIATKFW